MPLKVLKSLTENNFTTLGTSQFIRDTRLMTVRVREVMNDVNPVIPETTTLNDAIIKMSSFGFGAITVLNANGSLKGIFTDGDLRRLLQNEGEHILDKKLSELHYGKPIAVDLNALLNEAVALFRQYQVDTLLVMDGEKPVGMLDIQNIGVDLVL
jgi:signal-transduction protein with cAMP-binding, CBS, and nucleotidyltransferase domain